MLLSDFLNVGLKLLCAYLIARQLDVYAIQVLSEAEIKHNIRETLKLLDVEDDDVAEITASGPLLRRYKENLAAFRASLHDFCTRRGVSCLFHQHCGTVRSPGAALPAAARAGAVSGLDPVAATFPTCRLTRGITIALDSGDG